MFPIVSVDQMRKSDAYTIEHHVPGKELMYRAAYGVYLAARWEGRIAIVTGSGNNGGDGYALGCILADKGIECTVFFLGEPSTGDSKYYCQQAEEKGVRLLAYSNGGLAGHDMIVDCMLGTGFHGTPRGNYKAAIDEIDRSGAYVISVDINSGMNGDTGAAECAVHSDLTVTIGYIKQGLIAPAAGAYIRKLVCADIGIALLDCLGTVSVPDSSKHLHQMPAFDCPEWLDTDIIKAC